MSTTIAAPRPAVQSLDVSHESGERYRIAIRGHTIAVDQPVEAQGADSAPTPTELFVASLASCVAFYAGRYLSRHGITRDGLTVRADFRMSPAPPARVTAIKLRLTVPSALPESRWAALTAVVEHCTVHNSLTAPPAVTVELST